MYDTSSQGQELWRRSHCPVQLLSPALSLWAYELLTEKFVLMSFHPAGVSLALQQCG